MNSFTVAVVQMRSGADPQRNIEVMRELVRDAAGRGATYVQTPEMTGAVQRDKKALAAVLKPEERDEVAAAASGLAAELGVYLHLGSTAVKPDGDRLANRAFLFAPDGREVARYDKIHMFDVDLDNGESWRESAVYRPGTRTVVAELPIATVGLSICYDVRFPRVFQAQAGAGANVLTAPAAFTRQTGEAHWHVLQRSRAIECGSWMISAAQGGLHEDGRETYGHSVIIDPWGSVVAEIDHDEPGVAIAEIDVARSAEARQKIPNLKNGRDFVVDLMTEVPAHSRKAS
ncbi:MAG: carbon-nitrogen hydrolase family protein [Rhizobiaceae bacterium]